MGCGSSREGDISQVKFQTEDLRSVYILGRRLGSGQYGEVREVHLRSDKRVKRAVKIVERYNPNAARNELEQRLLAQMDAKEAELEQRRAEWERGLAKGRERSLLVEVKMLMALDCSNILKCFALYRDPDFL